MAATILVEVAFASNPGAAVPVWTDITAYVRAVSIRRGRQHELDQQQAGTATLVLVNSDGRFDPTNAGSPYSPNVLPMRRIRVSGIHSATTYPLFSGFVESWPQTWTGNNVGTVTITAADGFKVLGLKALNTSYAAERSDVRVANILNDIGWSTADRALSTGISMLSNATLENVNALAHLQAVTQTENGRAFISASGGFFFRDRHTPFSSTANNATFGDNSTEFGYVGIVVSYDETQIYNEIRCAITGGTDQIAADTATSQLRYFARTMTRSGMLTPDSNEAKAAANSLLAQYKDPALRIESIEISPDTDPANLYPQVYGRELGDRVLVKRRPPAGNTISQSSFIEGIELTFAIGALTKVVWRLSAVGITYAVGTPIKLDTVTAEVETASAGVLVY